MWDKLSIKDKAKIIKMGVANGIRDLDTIRDTYNNIYAEGGDTNLLNNQDFLNQYGIHWDEDPLMNDYYAQHPSELNKSTTAGMPAAYNNRVLVNRYGVPQSQQSLNRYARDYALVQPQVSRKEEREVEKKQADAYAEYIGNGLTNMFTGAWTTPSQLIGTFAHDDGRPVWERWLAGNTGIVDEKFAEEHPNLTILANTAFDFMSARPAIHGYTGLKNAPKALRARVYNYFKDAPYGYNTNDLFKALKETAKFWETPDPATLLGPTERDPVLREALKIPNYDADTYLIKDSEGPNYHFKHYPLRRQGPIIKDPIYKYQGWETSGKIYDDIREQVINGGENYMVGEDPANGVGAGVAVSSDRYGHLRTSDNWDLHPGALQVNIPEFMKSIGLRRLGKFASNNKFIQNKLKKLNSVNAVKFIGGQDVNVVNDYSVSEQFIDKYGSPRRIFTPIEKSGQDVISSLSIPYYRNLKDYMLPNFRSLLGNYNIQNK